MSKIIAFTNQKGGVSKTTSSVCLAINYALKGKKTLLIDCDQQANATNNILDTKNVSDSAILNCIMSIAKKYKIGNHENINCTEDTEEKLLGTYELLARTATIFDTIHKTEYENLDIIPAEVELALVESRLYNNAYLLRSLLNQIKDQYDIIIIDSAPAVNLLTYNILNAADLILIPIKLDLFSIKGSFQTINYMEQMLKIMEGANMQPTTEFRVFATMVNFRLRLTKLIYPVLKDILGDHLLNTKIRLQESAVLNTNNGSRHFALITGSKRSKIAEDYLQLIDELEGRD